MSPHGTQDGRSCDGYQGGILMLSNPSWPKYLGKYCFPLYNTKLQESNAEGVREQKAAKQYMLPLQELKLLILV